MADALLRKMLSQRFILTLGCGMVCTVLVWFGKIADGVFSAVVIATVGAYIAGDTWQNVVSRRNADV